MADGQLSLREQLQADYDALSAEETPQAGAITGGNAQAAPGGEAGAVEAATPEPAKSEAEVKLDATGRAHGADGKFAPKTPAETPAAEGATTQPPASPESAKPGEPEPQSEAIRIPPSLPAAIKAKFGSLDPDVQKAFVALEETVQTAKAEWGAKGQRLNRFEQLVGPRLTRWQMNGLDEFSGIQTLLAAQDQLDANPVQGLVQLARLYGVQPAHVAQAFGLSGQTSAPQPAGEGQQPQTILPDFQAALAPIVNGLQTLQQRFDANQQQSEASLQQQAQAEVQAFAADPANLYFNDVAGAVADLIAVNRAAGGQMTLKEAYDRAAWADPTIRGHLINAQAQAQATESARQAEEQRKAREAADRAKAQQANNAAGSVTGSPTPGSQGPVVVQGSVRDSLLAAMREHAAV